MNSEQLSLKLPLGKILVTLKVGINTFINTLKDHKVDFEFEVKLTETPPSYISLQPEQYITVFKENVILLNKKSFKNVYVEKHDGMSIYLSIEPFSFNQFTNQKETLLNPTLYKAVSLPVMSFVDFSSVFDIEHKKLRELLEHNGFEFYTKGWNLNQRIPLAVVIKYLIIENIPFRPFLESIFPQPEKFEKYKKIFNSIEFLNGDFINKYSHINTQNPPGNVDALEHSESISKNQYLLLNEFWNTHISNKIKEANGNSLSYLKELYVLLDFVTEKKEERRQQLQSYISNAFKNVIVELTNSIPSINSDLDYNNYLDLHKNLPTELESENKEELYKFLQNIIISKSTDSFKFNLWFKGILPVITIKQILDGFTLSDKLKRIEIFHKLDTSQQFELIKGYK